jgi:hypothetical protein
MYTNHTAKPLLLQILKETIINKIFNHINPIKKMIILKYNKKFQHILSINAHYNHLITQAKLLTCSKLNKYNNHTTFIFPCDRVETVQPGQIVTQSYYTSSKHLEPTVLYVKKMFVEKTTHKLIWLPITNDTRIQFEDIQIKFLDFNSDNIIHSSLNNIIIKKFGITCEKTQIGNLTLTKTLNNTIINKFEIQYSKNITLINSLNNTYINNFYCYFIPTLQFIKQCKFKKLRITSIPSYCIKCQPKYIYQKTYFDRYKAILNEFKNSRDYIFFDMDNTIEIINKQYPQIFEHIFVTN